MPAHAAAIEAAFRRAAEGARWIRGDDLLVERETFS